MFLYLYFCLSRRGMALHFARYVLSYRCIRSDRRLSTKCGSWGAIGRNLCCRDLPQRAFYATSLPELSSISLESSRASKYADVGKIRDDGRTGRFFRDVVIVKNGDGWEIELDGYRVPSKSGNEMVLPSESLAIGVALDWEYMHDRVDPRRMFLYKLASISVDLSKAEEQSRRKSLIRTFGFDLLGLRTEVENEHLNKLWIKHHDPIINWFQREFDTEFCVSKSIFAGQAKKTSAIIEKAVSCLDNWTLTGLAALSDSTLSVLISLALWNRVITVEEAVDAASVEHLAFEKVWGSVEGSTDLRRQELLTDVAASTFFLRSLPSDPLNGDKIGYSKKV